jgi:hypothetical protein
MSNGNRNQQDKSTTAILDSIKQTTERATAVMDDRMVMKMSLAQAMFKNAIESYGLSGMLKRKKELTNGIIQDLYQGFKMIDEVFDSANK